jgi:hypothetical protein
LQGDEESPELDSRLELGRRLYGNIIRFRHWPPGTGRLCSRLYAGGMVEIEGMSGMFPPDLFVIDELKVIPRNGEVYY